MFSPSTCFHPFESQVINLSEEPKLDLLRDIAVQEVQNYLELTSWNHNFGLTERTDRKPIGKMFGVLVVSNPEGDYGYLAGFSGKIGDANRYDGFVPPVFDGMEEGNFLKIGMHRLETINQQITVLEKSTGNFEDPILQLKERRKRHSSSLQSRIYESYEFLNQQGQRKSLKEIFKDARQSNPPGGAGDCAAPKLLQYAFSQGFEPLELVEFFWGISSNSGKWKHRHHYAPCKHKCEPILEWMLGGKGALIMGD